MEDDDLLRQMLDFEVGHRGPPPTPPAAVPPADANLGSLERPRSDG